MIKRVARKLGFALLLLVAAGTVRAEMVRGIYAAEVPVTDQSSTELSRASRQAMSEVLVKVSGSKRVLDNPVIAAALGGARKQVQRFSYSKDPANPGGLAVRADFDSTYINGLVIEAGVPLWTANRPVVLLWLVEEGADGRYFVNADTAPPLVSALRREFSRRGVPVRLPLYDLTDAGALNPDQAWSLDAPTYVLASARYALQDVLAGRFSRLPDGSVTGEWSYFQGEQALRQPVTAENEAQFWQQGVALVAEAMAARYAVAATGDTGGLTVAVTGVASYADYASVVSWLESLELVERADIEAVRGDMILLRLQAKADAAQLAAIIELNQQLVPILPGLPGGDSGAGAQLNYQWQK